MDEEKFVAAARNSAGGRVSRKINEKTKGSWLGGGRTDSFWLYHARPLVGKQKSEISCSRRRLKPTP